jgi:hypothetical protein
MNDGSTTGPQDHPTTDATPAETPGRHSVDREETAGDGDHDAPDHDAPDHDAPDHDAPDHDAPGHVEDADGDGDGEGASGPADTEEGAAQSRALAEVMTGAAPPRPPRRTGIFVDPDDLRDHVGQLLRAILGGYEVDAFGNYTFTHEGARVFVTVGGSPIGPTIGVFSVTNLEVDLTPPLAAYLLQTNHTLGFGAFSYDASNRSVWLRHTLLGTTLDGPELQSAVAAVATTAAHLDDQIRDRFGGRTFQESPGEVQRSVEPPGSPTSHPGATGYL